MLMPKRVKYRKQFRGRMRGSRERWHHLAERRFRDAGIGAWLDYQPPD